MKEAVLIRQRRVLVSAVLTALCLSVVITWRLFMHLPSSPQRSLHRTLPPNMVQKKQRLKKVTPMINDQQRKGDEQLDLRSFHDEKQIVIVLTHFRDSDSCAHTLVNTRAFDRRHQFQRNFIAGMQNLRQQHSKLTQSIQNMEKMSPRTTPKR
ncbi:hypothetical protein PsorP6_010510 [Peronosclerospora sorghi]|uniref:Uncharacterized protein n=1 Tax=Peronosclerospora sorghi TaxID=230839 RepID=A0ACC0VWB6_9STRA|nr:hypothetical protein PsorP6_010510 [Peronosclerospora sorghi]